MRGGENRFCEFDWGKSVAGLRMAEVAVGWIKDEGLEIWIVGLELDFA
jgi:hypothetical protein